MNPKFLTFVLAISWLNCGCESKSSGGSDSAKTDDFPSSLLTSYASWSPVLDGDVAFASSGHSGQTTRVYFNEIAEPHFKDEQPLPFTEGSYIAKAVVGSAETPTTAATRVYFMLKKASGFDSGNGDWSYAISNLEDGELKFDSDQGKISSCIGCHAAEVEWDYVRTVEYYRNQSAE